ncbi:hypothetical protein, partial [Salmonella enterica]|uniref:hypothetical protein n=1 Tax=Salmonella enterica TaxID=28901 RepID=UPI00329A2E08
SWIFENELHEIAARALGVVEGLQQFRQQQRPTREIFALFGGLAELFIHELDEEFVILEYPIVESLFA